MSLLIVRRNPFPEQILWTQRRCTARSCAVIKAGFDAPATRPRKAGFTGAAIRRESRPTRSRSSCGRIWPITRRTNAFVRPGSPTQTDRKRFFSATSNPAPCVGIFSGCGTTESTACGCSTSWLICLAARSKTATPRDRVSCKTCAAPRRKQGEFGPSPSTLPGCRPTGSLTF